MKIIKINEGQLKRLFEEDVPNFNGGDLKEYPGSEVSTTANVHEPNGELTYGKEPETDEFADAQTAQQWGARAGHRGGFGI